jgi:chromosome segregation ATPase
MRWKDDAAHWQAEHDALLKRLADMQRFVVEHGTSLTAHEAAFRGIEQSLTELERLIASYPEAEHTGLAEPMESRHRELSARVRHIDNAHQRMAKHHAEVGSRMADLERATSAPL